ncbi:MAG: YlxM family DNA-binding protein [Desulfitobacteriia bacterium]|jgi:predicted DNA-binding protein YlxM (UPF0122 family)
MEEIANKALLFDFYGPLLTAKQGKVWDLYYHQDLSLSEIAEQQGISRQAVHDLLKRTGNILEDYENKLGLVSLFLKEKEKMSRMENLLTGFSREDFSNERAWQRHLEVIDRIKDLITIALES